MHCLFVTFANLHNRAFARLMTFFLVSLPLGCEGTPDGTPGETTDGNEQSSSSSSDDEFVAAPSHFAAELHEDGVLLRWKDNSENEIHFMIQRKRDGGEFKEKLATHEADEEQLIDTSVEAGYEYSYRVRAMARSAAVSDFSEEVTIEVPDDDDSQSEATPTESSEPSEESSDS